MRKKHVHFIGIAGSAIAPIAVAMKNLGWNVTGSEHNKVWEPAKSFLANNDIDYTEEDFNLDNVKAADIIIVGGSAIMKFPQHPEILYAKKLNKPIYSFTYLVKNFILKKHSIVVSGNYGKTTTTALLAWIFRVAGYNPSFMIGGKPINFDSGVCIDKGEVSIVEGDEYVAANGFDMRPKFLSYNPTDLIVSSVEWDHVDVYSTEKEYIDAFFKLVKILQDNKGNLFLGAAGKNNDKIFKAFDGDTIIYGVRGYKKYVILPNIEAVDVVINDNQTEFSVIANKKLVGKFATSLLGLHNVENCVAAISVALQYSIKPALIKSAISTFKGVRRRLEVVKRYKNESVIIDDFAHSPPKISATLQVVRKYYPRHKIVAVYSPRMSAGVNRKQLSFYNGVFKNADVIFIPKIRVKKSVLKENRVYGKDMVNAVKAGIRAKVMYVPLENDLIDMLRKYRKEDRVVILFMGARGFDNIIRQIL